MNFSKKLIGLNWFLPNSSVPHQRCFASATDDTNRVPFLTSNSIQGLLTGLTRHSLRHGSRLCYNTENFHNKNLQALQVLIDNNSKERESHLSVLTLLNSLCKLLWCATSPGICIFQSLNISFFHFLTVTCIIWLQSLISRGKWRIK